MYKTIFLAFMLLGYAEAQTDAPVTAEQKAQISAAAKAFTGYGCMDKKYLYQAMNNPSNDKTSGRQTKMLNQYLLNHLITNIKKSGNQVIKDVQ